MKKIRPKYQLPNKPIESAGTVYFGIDLHKKNFLIAAINEQGEVLLLVKLETTAQNLVDAVNCVQADYKIVSAEEIALTRWAIDTIRPHVDEAFSCDPKQNAWIARDPHKNDAVDAMKIAKLSRMGELKPIWHQEDEDRYSFKIAIQHFHELKTDVVCIKNKIKAHLLRAGILETDGNTLFQQKNRKVYLDQLPVGPWRDRLARYYRTYDHLITEKKQAQKEYETLGQKYPEIENLRTMIGAGTESVHTFDALVSDPHRFTKKSQLYRFCALSISDKTSDGKSLGYERLEQNSGHKLLKKCSYSIFLAGVRHRTEIKTYYEAAKKANGGNATRARLTTQRKILATLWAIWKSGQNYDPKLFVYEHQRTSQPVRKIDPETGKTTVHYEMANP